MTGLLSASMVILALSFASPAIADDTLAWGPAVNGLELGIAAAPDPQVPTSINVDVYVKNVSDAAFTVDGANTLVSVMQHVVLLQNGNAVPYTQQFFGSERPRDFDVSPSAVRLVGVFNVGGQTSFSLSRGRYSISDNGTVFLTDGTSRPLITGTIQVTIEGRDPPG